jgi:NADH-quinone oxidoreductase subunit C
MSMVALTGQLQRHFADRVVVVEGCHDMVTIEVECSQLLSVCETLKTNTEFQFEQLIDVCGVDYSTYGKSDWRTHETTSTGFSRGQSESGHQVKAWDKPRFAVVYHLLSLSLNQRLRIRCFVDEQTMTVPSVYAIWPASDWFEREAFDLFGIQFSDHPDLRRLLTDYGFKGHPFRKDFPLIGEVELRYDAAQGRCVYEPVSIQPRVNVPKVIRDDNRYLATPTEDGNNG